jgi:hypothetical protein
MRLPSPSVPAGVACSLWLARLSRRPVVLGVTSSYRWDAHTMSFSSGSKGSNRLPQNQAGRLAAPFLLVHYRPCRAMRQPAGGDTGSQRDPIRKSDESAWPLGRPAAAQVHGRWMPGISGVHGRSIRVISLVGRSLSYWPGR